MNPKCTLPEEKRAEALEALRGWGLSEEEEKRIRALFPQYLFFRNEYLDDGWSVSSDPVRLCTCTACGESFEAVRGNYSRGRLHHERCNCPQCGAVVEGIAAGKYKYDMKSLERWVKVAVTRAGEKGELLVVAGNARRIFKHDCLTGDLDFYPEKKYYFGTEGCCEWKAEQQWEGCRRAGIDWIPTKTVGDPFQPNWMGYADYDGSYSVIGIGDALPYTILRYSQVIEFYERQAYVDLDHDRPARGVLKYLAWYMVHPQLEMAVKFGLRDAVEQLISEGRKNAELLNWRAKTPAQFLRLSKQDAKRFLNQEMSFDDLKAIKLGKDMSISVYLEICENIGGRDNMKELMKCAAVTGVSGRDAARYVAKLRPECARYAVPPRQIIRTWLDYLHMAQKLGYDLSVPTVAMPKDLQERHDAASQMMYLKSHEDELKKYKTRRRNLEKKYRFQMGGYCIVIPTSGDEIVREGKTLQHCVGGYAARHMAGTTTILFLRKTRTPGRSFLTLEMDRKEGKDVIRQIHGYKNERYGGPTKPPAVLSPEERFAWFLGPWLEWVNAGSERDRDGNPILPGAEEMKTEVKAV